MDRFQNFRQVPFSSSQVNEQNSNPNVYSRKIFENQRFYESGVRGEKKTILGQLSLARSGFMSASSLQQSNVRGPGRGIGNLPDDRLRQIAKDFVSLYGGSGGEISTNGLYRIQRQAYDKCTQKAEISEDSVKMLTKTMDQNRDGRVTEDDIISLCRRYLTCQKRPITYTPMVLERLAVARRLFNQFDVEKKGYLTEKQVPNLLSETYRSLGRTFNATEEDVKSWMRLADGDGDGQVTFDEYEKSIIRALTKQGIKIYEE